MKNLKEFKEKIKEYRSKSVVVGLDFIVCIDDILEKAVHQPLIYNRTNCKECVYVVLSGAKCNSGINLETYKLIHQAFDEKELKEAYDSRADHMESLIKHLK